MRCLLIKAPVDFCIDKPDIGYSIHVLAVSLVRVRRNSVNSASGLKTAIIIEFIDHDFVDLAERTISVFSLSMRINYLRASGQKSDWPQRSILQSGFPLRRVYYHHRMTSAAYIWCICAQLSCDLVTLTYDILTLPVINILSFMHPMYIPILSILQLSVTEIWVTQSLSHFLHMEQSLWPITT